MRLNIVKFVGLASVTTIAVLAACSSDPAAVNPTVDGSAAGKDGAATGTDGSAAKDSSSTGDGSIADCFKYADGTYTVHTVSTSDGGLYCPAAPADYTFTYPIDAGTSDVGTSQLARDGTRRTRAPSSRSARKPRSAGTGRRSVSAIAPPKNMTNALR